MVIEYRGLFKSKSISQNNFLEIDLSKYPPGINEVNDFFFKLSSNRKTEWVISRICDHANGKLSRKGCESLAKCPLHGWTLDLDTLEYINVQVKKEKINFEQKENILFIENKKNYLQVPEEIKTSSINKTSIRFLAHASLAITIDGFTIVTDPWLMGPCFMTGWWHKVVPKTDAMNIMMDADLIYISHNHPDHMHMESLSHLRKRRPDIPIVIPNFSSKSVEKPLMNYGFTNIIPLEFNNLYSIHENKILLSILKSGDFRDDSGIFFMAGGFSGLLTVDAAALNRMVLPRTINFLASAFAGGASGYPWCFEHYSVDQCQEINKKSRMSVLRLAVDYIKTTQTKYYMPYAGYFSEEANRDHFIKLNNLKNSVDDIKNHLVRLFPDVHFIDPRMTDLIEFDANGKMINQENIELPALYQLDQSYIDSYLEKENVGGGNFDIQYIAQYFLTCKFQDDLIVYLIPTDNSFEPIAQGLKIDFSGVKVVVDIMDVVELWKDYELFSLMRKKIIKVRKDPLWIVVNNALSWEELSIGFQCRIIRKPDVYNSKFWDYFTNYIY